MDKSFHYLCHSEKFTPRGPEFFSSSELSRWLPPCVRAHRGKAAQEVYKVPRWQGDASPTVPAFPSALIGPPGDTIVSLHYCLCPHTHTYTRRHTRTHSAPSTAVTMRSSRTNEGVTGTWHRWCGGGGKVKARNLNRKQMSRFGHA